MKTVTYDETKWQLVPVEATDEMADAARQAALPPVMLDSISARERLMFCAQYKAMLSTAPAPPSSVNWEDDALSWGGALNDAAWAFIEACPEKSTLLFNSAKASLRQAILVYVRKVGSNAISEDIDALRKDAERYRWIRGPDHESTRYSRWRIEYWQGSNGWQPVQRESMDEAIDAAMAAGGE